MALPGKRHERDLSFRGTQRCNVMSYVAAPSVARASVPRLNEPASLRIAIALYIPVTSVQRARHHIRDPACTPSQLSTSASGGRRMYALRLHPTGSDQHLAIAGSGAMHDICGASRLAVQRSQPASSYQTINPYRPHLPTTTTTTQEHHHERRVAFVVVTPPRTSLRCLQQIFPSYMPEMPIPLF